MATIGEKTPKIDDQTMSNTTAKAAVKQPLGALRHVRLHIVCSAVSDRFTLVGGLLCCIFRPSSKVKVCGQRHFDYSNLMGVFDCSNLMGVFDCANPIDVFDCSNLMLKRAVAIVMRGNPQG